MILRCLVAPLFLRECFPSCVVAGVLGCPISSGYWLSLLMIVHRARGPQAALSVFSDVLRCPRRESGGDWFTAHTPHTVFLVPFSRRGVTLFCLPTICRWTTGPAFLSGQNNPPTPGTDAFHLSSHFLCLLSTSLFVSICAIPTTARRSTALFACLFSKRIVLSNQKLL